MNGTPSLKKMAGHQSGYFCLWAGLKVPSPPADGALARMLESQWGATIVRVL